MLVVEGFNTQAVSLHLEIVIQRMHSYSHKCFYLWAVQTSNTAEKNFTCDKFEINFSFNRANKMGNFLRDIHLPHTGSILWSTPPLASGLHPLLLHYINRCSIFTTIFSHVNRNFYLTGSIFIILHGVSKDWCRVGCMPINFGCFCWDSFNSLVRYLHTPVHFFACTPSTLLSYISTVCLKEYVFVNGFAICIILVFLWETFFIINGKLKMLFSFKNFAAQYVQPISENVTICSGSSPFHTVAISDSIFLPFMFSMNLEFRH